MMKFFTIFCTVFYTSTVFCQALDTLALTREIDSLLKVSNTKMRKSEFREAIHAAEEANQKVLGLYGKNHLKYADSQHQLGVTYIETGELAKAEMLLKTGLQLRGALLGTAHKAYSTSLNGLGTMYARSGRLDSAAIMYEAARIINERQYGKRHFNYAMGLQNLANVYRKLGRYEETDALYLEAMAILKDTLGEMHPLYAMTNMNLGLSVSERGNYYEAEAIFLKTMAIVEKKLTKNHNYYYVSLLNLVGIYNVLGRYDEALRLIEEGKGICKALFGEGHFTVGEMASHAGLCYKALGQLPEAEQAFTECKEIIVKSLGQEHQKYIQALINLALLYQHQNKTQAARSLFEEGLALLDKSNMANTLERAVCKIGIGQGSEVEKRYNEAVQNYLDAAKLLESIGGSQLDEYKMVIGALADVYHHKAQSDSTIIYAGLLANIVRYQHQRAARFSSETDLMLFRHMAQKEIARIIKLSAVYPELVGEAFDVTLMTKHATLENKRRLQTQIAHADRSTLGKYHEWLGLQRRLSQEYGKMPQQRVSMKEWEQRANILEKELVRELSGFGQIVANVSWQTVQAALKPGEVALEFVQYPNSENNKIYGALLIGAGMQAPTYVSLGDEKRLQALLPSLGKNRGEYVSKLYTEETFAQIIWAPLQPLVQGARTVYYAPAGVLHRINLSAMPLPGTNRTIGDVYNLITLGSTRQIVQQSQLDALPSTAMLYGGIDYGAVSIESVSTTDSTRTRPKEHGFHAFGENRSWPTLGHSQKEITDIASFMQQAGISARLFTRTAATEETVKSMGATAPSPSFLHLSTHGYFFPDSPTNEENAPYTNREQPMIRSGLILAGANHAWKTGNPLGNKEDGVLTAYEISQMNLSNTELVVLSACETGLGDIRGDEGVYGLQRAFKIAGAKTLVMSLWQVPDYQTQELMTVFYQKLLLGKMSVRQALQSAQKEMRGKGYEPYYWAGFIVVE